MSDSYTVLGYKCLFQVSWLHRTVPGCILIYCYVLPRSKHMLTLICDRRQLQSSLPQSPELFKSVTWHLRSVMYNDYFMICMQKSVLHFVCLFLFICSAVTITVNLNTIYCCDFLIMQYLINNITAFDWLFCLLIPIFKCSKLILHLKINLSH